jgi:hypothetical protein
MAAQHSVFRFAAVTSPIYLALLWPVASLFRTGGTEVFAGGIVVLALGLLALQRGWRKPVFLLYLGVLLGAFGVGVTELSLHLAPKLLRGMAANYAFGRFHAHAGGIYELDAHMGKRIRPNQVCAMYFNGFRWTHDANAAGYRGQLLPKADAVFLGDSMIYGHGVETDQTVPFLHGVHTGQATANLGIQGTGLIQSWMQLRRLGPALQPKTVFVCSHPNDIDDVSQFYDAHEVEKFLAGGVNDETEPFARPRFHPPSAWHPRHVWDDYLALPLYSAGAVRVLGQGFKQSFGRLSGPVASTPAVEFHSPKNQWRLDTEKDRVSWKAHCLALAKIRHECDAIGARLVVFDLGFPEAYSAAMEAEARRVGADYSAAGRVALQKALAGDDIYLPADGHWSPQGCDVVAGELARCCGATH